MAGRQKLGYFSLWNTEVLLWIHRYWFGSTKLYVSNTIRQKFWFVFTLLKENIVDYIRASKVREILIYKKIVQIFFFYRVRFTKTWHCTSNNYLYECNNFFETIFVTRFKAEMPQPVKLSDIFRTAFDSAVIFQFSTGL